MTERAWVIVTVLVGAVILICTIVECDSCTDRNCPPGHEAVMLRGYGGLYECACVVRPRRWR